MFLLEFSAAFGSREQAKRFFDSIRPELGEEFLRSKASVAQRENVLVVSIKAADKTALRASLNSFLKPMVLFEQLEGLW